MSRFLKIAAIAGCVLGVASQTSAEEMSLTVPIDCDLTNDCSIQKYVDHDPGPDRRDYRCGTLSLDGDHGTDFRTRSYVEMDAGVKVLAAADGIVRATRDGMQDISVRSIDRSSIEGREAGNAVVIDHGGGWQTQYSHLRRGSVGVVRGQAVKQGEPIGLMGLSGNTEFPHLEFSVRKDGRPVDPFVGDIQNFECGSSTAPLWAETELVKMPYRATVLLNAGFSDEKPKPEKARRGRYNQSVFASDADKVLFWYDVSGVQEGDIESVVLLGPTGEAL
ncbi:MAG: M23 family metallopeptidase, partial [Pseudomonadota bacterium]